jgi:hypothetical protein
MSRPSSIVLAFAITSVSESHSITADGPAIRAEGRFGKQDLRYVVQEDVYVCPAGERLAYYYTTEDKGLVLTSDP